MLGPRTAHAFSRLDSSATSRNRLSPQAWPEQLPVSPGAPLRHRYVTAALIRIQVFTWPSRLRSREIEIQFRFTLQHSLEKCPTNFSLWSVDCRIGTPDKLKFVGHRRRIFISSGVVSDDLILLGFGETASLGLK